MFGLLRASSVRTMHHGAFRSSPAGKATSGARHASAAVPTLEPAWALTALLVVVDFTSNGRTYGGGCWEQGGLWEPGRRARLRSTCHDIGEGRVHSVVPGGRLECHPSALERW